MIARLIQGIALLTAATAVFSMATVGFAQQFPRSRPPRTSGLRRLPEVAPAISLQQQPAPQRLPTVEGALASLESVDFEGDADETELAKRIDSLESKWEVQQAAEAAKKAQAARRPTFDITGRIHFDSTWFPEATEGIGFFENPTTGVDPEDRFFFRRIRLEMQGDVLATMLWRIQIDFNDPSTPEYKDVYIGFRNLPLNHLILVGNQKRPLGLDHLNSSRFNLFMERPLVVETFNSDARRIGACAYTYTDDLVYNLRYGVYNLENTRSSGEYIGDALQLGGNARLASCPWYDESSGGRGYYHWALAGMVAHPDGDAAATDSNSNEADFSTRPELRSNRSWIDTGEIAGADWYEIAALESVLNLGPWQFVGEYQTNWLQRDDVTPGAGPDVFFHGGYVYVHYMLTGEHVPWDRESGTIDRLEPFENFFLVDRLLGRPGTAFAPGALGVGARLSYLDLTDADIQGGAEANVTLGLNWWWTAYSKLQVNLIHGQIVDHAPLGGFTEGSFLGFSTRMMADF